MKKNVLIGVIVAVVILGGVIAWYFLRDINTNKLPAPNPSGVDDPVTLPDFKETYQDITKEQRDCLVKAIGQTKLDGFLKNDVAVMQTITGDEYEKVLACPQ